MTEEKELYSEEEELSRDEVAHKLIDLAQDILKGKVMIKHEGSDIEVELAEKLEYELELEEEEEDGKRTKSLEVEITWKV